MFNVSLQSLHQWIRHLKSETPYVLEIYGVLIHDMTIIFADPIP